MQEKKKAEADKQKELNDLFAIAIKQPKVPPGKRCYSVAVWLFTIMAVPCLVCLLLLKKPYHAPKHGSPDNSGTMCHILRAGCICLSSLSSTACTKTHSVQTPAADESST